MSWTPETCAYQGYQALGVDPMTREALRQRVMIMQAQADEPTSAAVADSLLEWQTCVGRPDLTAADLFRLIDGEMTRSDVNQTTSAKCATAELRADAVSQRAGIELELAKGDRPVVEAWIEVLDREARVAGAAGS